MTSKDDDDTLPLPGTFSEELSVDITADEDFIPTSQPKSGSSKITKKPESIIYSSDERDGGPCDLASAQLSLSAIDATVLLDCVTDQSLDKDKFNDFIPETETKQTKHEFLKQEITKKRKLSLEDSFVKFTEDIFDTQPNSHWDIGVTKIAESPNIEIQSSSVINDTSVAGVDSPSSNTNNKDIIVCSITETEKICEESVTEILVNASAETVELDASGNSSCQSEVKKTDMEEKLSPARLKPPFCDFNSDTERCEETQIFDNSLVLLVDQQGPSLNYEKDEKTQNSLVSEKLYLAETINDNELSQLEGMKCMPLSRLTLSTMENMSKKLSSEEAVSQTVQAVQKSSGNIEIKEQHNLCSTPTSSPESNNSSLETKKLEFKLSVSCIVTINSKTKQVVQKLILNVNELPKRIPKRNTYVDHNLENTSDKSKRCSTSSSGSVYSDKTGLPFALPKRVTAISDQADVSDSSEEGFTKLFLEGKNAFHRTPWSNEYLLPLKMDELMKFSLESPEPKRPTNAPSPTRFVSINSKASSHLEEIAENSSFEYNSVNHFDSVSNIIGTNNTEAVEKYNSNSESPHTKKVSKDVTKEDDQMEKDDHEETENRSMKPSESSNYHQPQPKTDNHSKGEKPKDLKNGKVEELQSSVKKTYEDENEDCTRLRHGLPVFARWTDKRYYSGVITSIGSKNDRWDVKFDDGTIKALREDFMIPAKWLKSGELVLALVNDKYISGQLLDAKLGEEGNCVVELDNEKKKIDISISDLCLTEVLAGIIKEKHKPLLATPRGKGSEIDFDNVLTGKRHREQKTPVKNRILSGNSGTKKTTTNKKLEIGKDSEPSIKETPQKKTANSKDSSKKVAGLQSNNGHLVEDKVMSTDSPSGNDETGPLSKGSKGKAKPRSLSYEAEGDSRRRDKAKTSDWLTLDGTPIPGPSGIKFRKRTRTGNPKFETVNKSVLTSVEEEKTTPVRSTRNSGKKAITDDEQSDSKKSKSAKKTPLTPQFTSTKKQRGKRKLMLDEPTEIRVQAKSFKKGDNRKEKPRSRRG